MYITCNTVYVINIDYEFKSYIFNKYMFKCSKINRTTLYKYMSKYYNGEI